MKRILLFIGIGISALILLPALASPENPSTSVCEDYKLLEREDMVAVFTAFQGEDDFETASQLLQNRDANGNLPKATQIRFANAQAEVFETKESRKRRARMEKIAASASFARCNTNI